MRRPAVGRCDDYEIFGQMYAETLVAHGGIIGTDVVGNSQIREARVVCVKLSDMTGLQAVARG